MRVVFAPDSFKGSIPAQEAAAALAAGWASARPGDDLVLRPMADGGEGTRAAFLAAIEGTQEHETEVVGPDGASHLAPWLMLPDDTAFIELAAASGIELLGERRLPFDAHTLGFGQLIVEALSRGATRVLLGIGSSASTDAGTGMLRALGARFLDSDGREIALGLRGLEDLASVDLTGLIPLPPRGVLVLSDVDNPLLGPRGAAHVFGPQKGLDERGVELADLMLARFAALLGADPDRPGAGAAGGTGYALQFWGAELGTGATEVARIVGLPDALDGADLVVTGEGKFDVSSAHGKVPASVADLAASAGVPAALVAGAVAKDADVSAFATVLSLTSLAGSAAAAMSDASRWLRAAGQRLAHDAGGQQPGPAGRETAAG